MNVFYQLFRVKENASQRLHTARRQSARTILLLTALATVTLNACRDDDMLSALQYESNDNATRADFVNTSGLTVSPTRLTGYAAYAGYTYSPGCRVPLVGEGRVVNNLTQSLVNVLSADNRVEYVVNDQLDDYVSFEGVADINTGLPILSVKDVNRVYYNNTKGIKVGFAYQTTGSVLGLSVLSGFWIETYLKGVKQDGSTTQGSGDSFELLNLNLLNVAGGLSEISFTTKKPFDEVRIGNSSINVTALGGMKFYYAFVGDNEEKIAAEAPLGYTDYQHAEGEETYSIPLIGGLFREGWINCSELTDSDPSNGDLYSMISALSFKKYRVNFKSDIPAESEIGFNITTADLLEADLSGTILHALDADNNSIQTINLSTGISLSAVSGNKSYLSFKTEKTARGIRVDFPVSVKLGATYLHYAYSRDPVTVDVSSEFSLGNDTIWSDRYTLPATNYNGGSVSYRVEPANGVTPSLEGNQITGMTADGNYVVTAEYTSADGKKKIIQKAIITRKSTQTKEGCNNRMINTGDIKGYQAEATIDSGGQLIDLFSQTHSAGNLVDSKPDNYAECISALSLIQARGIVAVTSASPITLNEKSRVGFVMQTSNTLLSADVLRFFFIRLYNGTEEVGNSLTQTNNTVGVGLLGGDGSQLRFYLETEGTTFDRVELWTAGLLNLNLNKFRLYYAFYEPTTCANQSGTSAACMELITTQKHGAEINYSETGSSAAVSVGSTLDNLANVLDNSLTTHAQIVKVASVIGRTTIAVKFNEIGAGQPVGAVISNPAYLTNVGLLSQISLVAYTGGTAVADNTTSGGVASVEVIGDDGLSTIEVTPQSPYDEVRITFPSVADVGKVINVHGFYTRPDLNNNGIPDCAEEPDDQTTVQVKTWDHHVCADAGTQQGTIGITLSGLKEGTTYSARLTCYPYNGVGQTVECNVTSAPAGSNGQTILEVSLPVGDYSISGLPYNGLHAQVHPLQTTWKKAAADTDWNNWNNWTNGSPWTCTNVVIPGGATRYPELTAWNKTDSFWGANYCSYIHFEPGAAVLNTHYLDYDGAYVEMLLSEGSFHNVAAPLHGMVTGDMFVSPEMPAYFTPLNATSYPEVRHNPIVRQRMWSRTVPYATSSGTGGTWAAEAEWSRTFNAVNQAYDEGQGFSMKVGDALDGNTSYRLRFPKAYDEYHYFTLGGVQTGSPVRINRDKDGRFVYEETGYNPEDGSGTTFTYTLTNENGESTEFVAGNPFMSYLDIRQLLTRNTGISAIRVETEEGYVTYTLETDGSLQATTTGTAAQNGVLAPMQAFYVSAQAKGQSLGITYTESMFVQPQATQASTRSSATSGVRPETLAVSAVTAQGRSTCLVSYSNTATDAFRTGEDIPVLIDRECLPKVKVYTVADQRALDIQRVKDGHRIALGFLIDTPQQAQLTLDYGSRWKGWTLVDTRTQTRHRLDGNRLTLTVDGLTAGEGRFYLEKTEQ